MKTVLNHLINNRTLITFTEIEQELQLQKDKNYLFDLSYLGVLDVIGPKAEEFLQGQLSCDIQMISDIQMIQGAQCSLQGRILALMDVLDWQGIKLVLPTDLQESTIKSLIKTAILSRVALKENKTLTVFGFYLQNQGDIVPNTDFFSNHLYALTSSSEYCYYHLGHGFYIFLIKSELAEKIRQNFAKQNQLLGSLTWHTLRLAKQQIDIYPESRNLFLPHRVDLQKTAYLSFNKGCYKGQEIIARMHYKATLKHELRIYTIETDDKLYSGQKLLSPASNAELGELIDFSPLGKGRYLIAVSILKNGEPEVLFEGGDIEVKLNVESK